MLYHPCSHVLTSSSTSVDVDFTHFLSPQYAPAELTAYTTFGQRTVRYKLATSTCCPQTSTLDHMCMMSSSVFQFWLELRNVLYTY